MTTSSERSLRQRCTSRAFGSALWLALGSTNCGDGALILIQQAEPAPLEPSAGPDGDPTQPTDPTRPETDPGVTEGNASDPRGNEGNPNPPLDGNPPPGGNGGEPSPFAACQPRASGGPFWLTEQESVRITLECATGERLPGEAFELIAPPPNLTYDPASRSVTFTPGLDQAGVYGLGVRVAGSEDSGRVEVQVADRFDAPDNVPVDPSTYTEEFGLPVVHLVTDPGLNEETYLPAAITYRGKVYAGAEAKYRGQTSLNYPKKSFTLKFAKEDRFEDPQSVAGFTGKRKLTLTTTFDDSSYLRARLAFELWNRIGVEHVQVQAYSAVLYLNGAFRGLYTIIDHVDKHLMEDNGFFEDGNLYKARTHDANFGLMRTEAPGGAKLALSEGFTKEEGTPLPGEPGANADLEDLVNWVASSSGPDFIAQLDKRLARREYEDWWLLVSLILANDSAGKNSYHYRDPRVGAPDGRFHVVPWDFNESFGQTWLADRVGREPDVALEKLSGRNLLFQRFLSEPSLRAPLVARYRSVLTHEWEIGSVLASLDAWAAEIQPVAARDELRWSERIASYYAGRRSVFPTFQEEVAYVRQWLVERWSFALDAY